MPRHLSPWLRVSILLVVLACAQGTASAQPADGTIISREAVVLPDDAPEVARNLLGGVTLERIIYASDGLEVEGFLARPADATDDQLPCVIFNRGGNRDFGGITPVRAAFLLCRIAKRGYVVVASNYRGNGAFGRDKYPGERVCEECESPIGGLGREEFGGADVNDILALIPLLERLDEADTSRMGIFGWSRGGMMTYLALKASNRFKAAIVGAGLADLAAGIEQRPGMEAHVYSELIPGWDDPDTRAAAISDRSAVQWADALPESTPILILHGTGDWRVDPTHALDMAGLLLAAKRPYRLVMFEGGDHGLSEFRDEVDDLVDDWLDRYVRDGESWPSLEPHGR
jgi:dipeptidyl aminopeptidase/acylaminoacyl peptidase